MVVLPVAHISAHCLGLAVPEWLGALEGGWLAKYVLGHGVAVAEQSLAVLEFALAEQGLAVLEEGLAVAWLKPSVGSLLLAIASRAPPSQAATQSIHKLILSIRSASIACREQVRLVFCKSE